MGQLFTASLPYLPATLGALILLLHAPLVGEVGRRRIALLFTAGAAACFWVAFQQGSTPVSLDVVNPFPMGEPMESRPVLIERVEAPGWQWGVVCGVFCGLWALVTFAAVRGRSQSPPPVLWPLVVVLSFVALRLVLEKSAAPGGLVWATGGSMGLPILIGYTGYYAAAKRKGYLGMLGVVFLLALGHRLVITVFGYLATSQGWGTHLDVTAVTELNTPLGGQRALHGTTDKWIWAMLVPQMGLWLAATMVLGATLGALTWNSGRRR